MKQFFSVSLAILAAAVGLGARASSDPAIETSMQPPLAQSNPGQQLNFIDPESGPLPKDAIARIGSTRFRHDGTISQLLFSPDGKWLASASFGEAHDSDNTARLWDAVTGKERLRVDLKRAYITPWLVVPIGFSSDSKEFLVFDQLAIRSFDIATGAALKTIPLAKSEQNQDTDQRPTTATISPDGKSILLIKSESTLEIFDAKTGRLVKTADVGQRSFGIKCSRDSSRFLVESSENVRVFDMKSLQRLGDIQDNDIHLTGFLPDGERIAAVAAIREGDRQRDAAANVTKQQGAMQQAPIWQSVALRIYDVKSGKHLSTFLDDQYIHGFAIAPDGKSVVIGNWAKSKSRVIDAKTGKDIGHIATTPSATHMVFSQDGKRLAGSSSGSCAISVWDMATRTKIPTAAEPSSFSWALFASDGKGLVVPASGSGRAVVDWRTGVVIRRLADLESRGVFTTALSPDQKLFAIAEPDFSITLTNADTGKVIRRLISDNFGNQRIAISRIGGRLVSLDFKNVLRVWDLATGLQISKFSSGEDLNQPDFMLSDDGRILVTSRGGNPDLKFALMTWDLATKKQLAKIEGPGTASLSADGRWVAGSITALEKEKNNELKSETAVGIWDASSGRLVKSLPGHEVFLGMPFVWCGFNASAQMLFTGDSSGAVRIWEVLSGQEMYRFEGHRLAVEWGDISPDGRFLLTASNDAPCFLWDIFGTEKPHHGSTAPEKLWLDLADADAKKAFLAMKELVCRPGLAIDLVRQNLKPHSIPEDDKLEKLIRDLDSPNYAIREKATVELTKIAPAIEPALAKAATAASLELRLRIERILERAMQPTPQRLRENRAVGILEVIGTPESAKLLGELATRSKYATLTVEASAASDRLKARLGK